VTSQAREAEELEEKLRGHAVAEKGRELTVGEKRDQKSIPTSCSRVGCGSKANNSPAKPCPRQSRLPMSCVTLQRSFASKPRPADHQHRGRAVSLESFLSQEEVSAKGGQDFTNYWKIVEIVQENPKYLIR
jgi:hypothetical protein